MTSLATEFLRHATGRTQRERIRAALAARRAYDTLHCERCRKDTRHTIDAGEVWTRFTCGACGKWEDYR